VDKREDSPKKVVEWVKVTLHSVSNDSVRRVKKAGILVGD